MLPNFNYIRTEICSFKILTNTNTVHRKWENKYKSMFFLINHDIFDDRIQSNFDLTEKFEEPIYNTLFTKFRENSFLILKLEITISGKQIGGCLKF